MLLFPQTKVLADDLMKPTVGALAMASLGIKVRKICPSINRQTQLEKILTLILSTKTLDSNYHDTVLVIFGSIAIVNCLLTFTCSSADICTYSKLDFFSIPSSSRQGSSSPLCNKES